ncbi:hypothetical protein J2Z40_000883 [Cytobacillus eiseniae]|uniref:Uncharacterized protein n=1 Tax=Cytobacillus eiseniae TaxID=762947 RepID=A0ABS4RBP9_9BACI|nr:hypothetical protein [Cytobacillus eiseniae]MBP2240328.1 hypothetical protein [Cytobacillus eiseniae]
MDFYLLVVGLLTSVICIGWVFINLFRKKKLRKPGIGIVVGFVLILVSVFMPQKEEVSFIGEENEIEENIKKMSDNIDTVELDEYKQEHLELVTGIHFLFIDAFELHKDIEGNDNVLSSDGVEANIEVINDELMSKLKDYKDIVGELPKDKLSTHMDIVTNGAEGVGLLHEAVFYGQINYFEDAKLYLEKTINLIKEWEMGIEGYDSHVTKIDETGAKDVLYMWEDDISWHCLSITGNLQEFGRLYAEIGEDRQQLTNQHIRTKFDNLFQETIELINQYNNDISPLLVEDELKGKFFEMLNPTLNAMEHLMNGIHNNDMVALKKAKPEIIEALRLGKEWNTLLLPHLEKQ